MHHPTCDERTPDLWCAESELQDAIAELTPLQQRICHELMVDANISRIARETQLSRSTIQRHIGIIQQALTAGGYDQWLQ